MRVDVFCSQKMDTLDEMVDCMSLGTGDEHRKKLRSIVDKFYESGGASKWMERYAQQANRGKVRFERRHWTNEVWSLAEEAATDERGSARLLELGKAASSVNVYTRYGLRNTKFGRGSDCAARCKYLMALALLACHFWMDPDFLAWSLCSCARLVKDVEDDFYGSKLGCKYCRELDVELELDEIAAEMALDSIGSLETNE